MRVKQPREGFQKAGLSWRLSFTVARNGQEEDHKDHENVGAPQKDGYWNGAKPATRPVSLSRQILFVRRSWNQPLVLVDFDVDGIRLDGDDNSILVFVLILSFLKTTAGIQDLYYIGIGGVLFESRHLHLDLSKTSFSADCGPMHSSAVQLSPPAVDC